MATKTAPAAKTTTARRTNTRKPATADKLKRGGREWTLNEAKRIEATLEACMESLTATYEALDVVYTQVKTELRQSKALVKTLSK